MSVARMKDMERAVGFLTGPARSDISVRDEQGKGILHLAMDSADPVGTTWRDRPRWLHRSLVDGLSGDRRGRGGPGRPAGPQPG